MYIYIHQKYTKTFQYLYLGSGFGDDFIFQIPFQLLKEC
jgi:hypothetical protein